MAVYVHFKGGLGNNLFQYCAGRLLARKSGVEFRADFPESETIKEESPHSIKSPRLKPPFSGVRVINDATDLRTLHLTERDDVVLDGWFQQWDYYWLYRDEIKTWFRLPPVIRHDDCAVAHVRLGDYATSWRDGSRVIEPSWYRRAIEAAGNPFTFVVMQELDAKYITEMGLKGAEHVRGSESFDFHYMRSFARMIMSNSTYSWWAFFLGHGERAWVFPRWVDDPQVRLTRFPGAVPIEGGFWR